MWSARQIRQYIEKQQLVARGDRILVAVSGGPDSVALLRLLLDWREELGLALEVAHLQHGIRGEEARQDARFVARLAEKFNLHFHLQEVSVPDLRSAAGKGNLEALARHQRYRFFAEVMRARGLTKVATAHTRDDQAETVLMWWLRGSGMKGLAGMAPWQQMSWAGDEITVVRPLLDSAKAELLAYLAENGQDFRIDRTNCDPGLLRNWIRLELLPKIEDRFGARVRERLSRGAELLRAEDGWLDELARCKLGEIASGRDLSRQGLMAQPVAMRRRLLRLWIEAARGNLRRLDFVHIDSLLHLIEEGPPHGRLALPGGWELARQYDRLELVRRSSRPRLPGYAYEFVPGSTLTIADAGWQIRSELIEPQIDQYCADSREALFDMAGLTGPLIVRNFRTGDYFQPLGMVGHKKIKDLFIEHKLPLALRATLPLVALGSEVLWAPGYGRSERAKVTATSRIVLRLKLVEMKA